MKRVVDQPTHWLRTRRWLRVHGDVLAIFAMTSVMIVGVWHLGQQQTGQLRESTEIVCARQDRVIAVLSFIVSDKRQATFGPQSAAREASNAELRRIVRSIGESPCGKVR